MFCLSPPSRVTVLERHFLAFRPNYLIMVGREVAHFHNGRSPAGLDELIISGRRGVCSVIYVNFNILHWLGLEVVSLEDEGVYVDIGEDYTAERDAALRELVDTTRKHVLSQLGAQQLEKILERNLLVFELGWESPHEPTFPQFDSNENPDGVP